MANGPEAPKISPESAFINTLKDLLTKGDKGHAEALKLLNEKAAKGELTAKDTYIKSIDGKTVNPATIFTNKSGKDIAIVYKLGDGTKLQIIPIETPAATFTQMNLECDPKDKLDQLRQKIAELKKEIDNYETKYNETAKDKRPGSINYTGDGNLLDNWEPVLEELLLNYKKIIACDPQEREKIKQELKEEFIPRLAKLEDYCQRAIAYYSPKSTDPSLICKGTLEAVADMKKELHAMGIQ